MYHHKHLTLEERERILKYLSMGFSIGKIAIEIGRSKSTIARELKRNTFNGDYLPITAEAAYKKRRMACRPKKLLDNSILFELVKEKFLCHQWSPEEISGRMRYEESNLSISVATIYRAIYAGIFDEPNLTSGNRGAVRKLRHRGKSRHTKEYKERRGQIQISNDIDTRPIEATNRTRFGDWEADTVAGVTGKACLVTLVDRKSRYLVGGKASIKKSDEVNKVMITALTGQPLQSITPDRGKEFAKHSDVTEHFDKVQFYFPKPHHPWQRGTNENTNGLLREYFPRGKDISEIPEDYIQKQYEKLNKRPRKCLGYKTPYEVYHKTVLHLV